MSTLIMIASAITVGATLMSVGPANSESDPLKDIPGPPGYASVAEYLEAFEKGEHPMPEWAKSRPASVNGARSADVFAALQEVVKLAKAGKPVPQELLDRLGADDPWVAGGRASPAR